MRAVLDTNVLIAALISLHGAPARAIHLWTNGEFDLVTSTWQVEELRRASRYDRIRQRVNAAEVGTFVNALRRNALVIKRLPNVTLSSDPDDDNILATALAGEAHYLVTGDKSDLLSLEKVQHLRIVTVRDFVGLLD